MAPARTLLLVLGLLLVVAPARSPRAEAAPKGTKVANAPYPDAFRARVRKAVVQGVAYLRGEQLRPPRSPDDVSDDVPEGLRETLRRELERARYEEAAAVAWVLRRAGVPSDDPAFAQVAKTLGAREPEDAREAALVVLGLTALPLPDGDPLAMGDPKPGAAATATLDAGDRALVETALRRILDQQARTRGAFGDRELARGSPESLAAARLSSFGGWGRPGVAGTRTVLADVATTYLALLALESASRAGFTVPPRVFLDADEFLVACQAPKGPRTALKMNEVRGADRYEWTETAQARGFSFAASMGDAASGYETTAGALGLVVCQDVLQAEASFAKPLRERTQAGIRDALAWVQVHYDITKNPVVGSQADSRDIAEPLYHHHWLLGLARLALHARMRFVGGHDWYLEGAEALLTTQRDDGSWRAIWWSNCYAMLFLLRASLASSAPVVTDVNR